MLLIISLGAISVYHITSGATSTSCICAKVGTSNIEVMDEDTAGTALAFFLLEDFSVRKINQVSNVCNQENMFYINFATEENKEQSVFMDKSGAVYKCS